MIQRGSKALCWHRTESDSGDWSLSAFGHENNSTTDQVGGTRKPGEWILLHRQRRVEFRNPHVRAQQPTEWVWSWKISFSGGKYWRTQTCRGQERRTRKPTSRWEVEKRWTCPRTALLPWRWSNWCTCAGPSLPETDPQSFSSELNWNKSPSTDPILHALVSKLFMCPIKSLHYSCSK